MYLSALAYKTPVWCSFQPIPQRAHMHAHKHIWNDGAATTAREVDAGAGSSARLVCPTQSTTFTTSIAKTSLYQLPETPIPLNPPPLFLHTPEQFEDLPSSFIPQNSSRTTSKRSFSIPTLMLFQSAQLWKGSVQLHNGPLHTCGKIRGNAAVQQSPSRRSCRRAPVGEHAGVEAEPDNAPSSVVVRKQQRVNTEQPKPTASYHTVMTTRCLDNTCSSALVQSQSTWSMAHSGCEPRR